MPRQTLSDVGIRALPPPARGQIDIWDTTLPSFGVRVSQGGSKTFVLKLHNSRRAIGRYPIITLSQARTEAKRLLAEKTLGKTRPRSITFTEAFDIFIEEKSKSRRARTVKDYNRLIKLHFPFKGQLSEITHEDIERRLRKITAPSEHNHALQNAKTFFTWAHKRRLLSENPTIGFTPHGTLSRARVLTDAELKSIWKATDDNSHHSRICRLLILTGQRKSEIAALQTSWIQEKRITIPSAIAKNHNEHTFPLPDLSLRLIASCTPADTGLLFPARGSTTKPFNGWSKSKAALDRACGVAGWTLHDLRRTYRTTHAKIGTPPHIAERLVNHISAQTDMERVYDQYKYWPELIIAVQQYENHLKKILGG